jgi:LIM domain
MGFCRRCGEIVAGTRCKCGGMAVGMFILLHSSLLVNSVYAAPVVPWNQSRSEEKTPDRWSKTYVHRERSVSPTRPLTTNFTGSVSSAPSASPTKRFPRPASNSNVPDPLLSIRVSTHIASATSQNRPPSPLKYSSTLPDPDSDILPSLAHPDATLSKVYGSVLQPKESLTTHSCAICSSAFPPDATIYPDPTVADSSRFLCRPCFTTNGGSRGPCGVCSRPVLILTSEGGFIEAAEKYWHKRCFNCSGCSKNIGDSPMLDLFGNPSCAECFDNCLKRGLNTPKKHPPSDGRVNKVNNIGGMNFDTNSQQSREGSPAVEELEQRLGMTKSREGSPVLEELSQRLSLIGKESSARYSASGSPIGRSLPSSASRENSPLVEQSRSKRSSQVDKSPGRRYYSPIRGQTTGSPGPTQEAVEEMKQRFLKEFPSSSAPRTLTSTDRADPPSITHLPSSRSSTPSRARSGFTYPSSLFDKTPASPLSPIIPQTPDLMSDFSDTTTQSSSSGPDSPPRNDEDFNELFRIPGLEETFHYAPHDMFHPLQRLAEEGTPNVITSPTHTPKSFKSYEHTSSFPSKVSTSGSDSTRHPSVKPKPLQSPDELIIPPSNSTELTASARCAECGGNLFSVREGGRFVTVPNDDSNTQALTYHTDCFRCVECHGIFKQANMGQAVFVKSKNGPCHVEVRLLKLSRS